VTLEGLSYELVPGTPRDPTPVLYALSTCGFCMRSMEFLKSRGEAFRYVYFDKLEAGDKERVRQMIRSRRPGAILFPVLFLSDTQLLMGFLKEDWERALT